MSDGIKKMYDDMIEVKKIYDDMIEDDNKSRYQHIESLGSQYISVVIKELSTILNRFDSDSLLLSRDKWGQLDEIKKIVRNLQP
jgi:hypothetical protein